MVKTKHSLQIARVAEERDGQMIWTGGDTVVVQLGDVLDRGDTEIGAKHQHNPQGYKAMLLSAALVCATATQIDHVRAYETAYLVAISEWSLCNHLVYAVVNLRVVRTCRHLEVVAAARPAGKVTRRGSVHVEWQP